MVRKLFKCICADMMAEFALNMIEENIKYPVLYMRYADD